MLTLEIFLGILTLAGLIYNRDGSVLSYYLWSVANAGWMAFAIHAGHYVQAGMFAVCLVACIHGAWSWRRIFGRWL